MKTKSNYLLIAIFFLYSLGFIAAISVDTDYITTYPGEQEQITLTVNNNEKFDIEDVSAALILENLPFNIVGSSEKDLDDLDRRDDDSASFTIVSSTSIKPGDYEIPYEIRYTNLDTDEKETKTGSFGIRVSAKTEIDFSVEVNNNAIIGTQGKVSLEIINKGLGDLKSISVQVFPEGYELLSPSKVFIGSIGADDTDLATFDVIYKITNPTLKATINYKDFENNDQTKTITLPFKVYTEEEALSLGLIKKSKTSTYIGIIILVIIIWFVYRKIKKRNKKNKTGS